MAAPFLDSNILIYAASQDTRSETARTLVQQHFIISVQCLNEFANVARRKLMMSWDEIAEMSGLYRELADAVIALDADLHARALELAGRYGYSFYDAAIIAAAAKAGCKVLYSEDMQSGQELDEGIEIINPFASGS